MKKHNGPVRMNVNSLYLAEVSETDNSLVFGAPEFIDGIEEITRKPTVASGELFGGGKKRFNVSRKTGYELSLNHNGIPVDWLSYMEGTTVSESGVESGTSKDAPKPFAIGWDIDKIGTDGKIYKQLIWFLFCTTEPVEISTKQSEENTNFSTDSLSITALEHNSLGKFYTMIDTERDEVTQEMVDNFFTKVQTGDSVEKGTATETPKETVK